MRICLDQVIPHPLMESEISSSEIWGKSLTFEKPDFIRIEAQSGKGKSTLLHILYGLRFDYQGSCKIDGLDISSLSKEKWRGLWTDQLSLLFQDLRLFLHLSARENLELLPSTYKQGPSMVDMCKELAIDHLLDCPVTTLSFGQRQRFALVRSLLKPFNWLLLDEPFSHLDEKNAVCAAHLIKTCAQLRNAGVLYTSLSTSSPLPNDHTLSL
jgi:ABC-type lipoprotein export system ATPase subunit